MQVAEGDYIIVVEGRYIYKDIKAVAYDLEKGVVLGYTESDGDNVYAFPTHVLNLSNCQQISVYTPDQYRKLETDIQEQKDNALAEAMEMLGGKKAQVFDLSKFNKGIDPTT